MAAPLIKPIQVDGGTFYQFTSAANDISGLNLDSDREFTFSKLAALDIPDVKTPSNGENAIVWEALGYLGGNQSSVPVSSISANQDINFAQSFQNYVLNLERSIMAGRNDLGVDYDPKVLNSVAERSFWKWLSALGAIRFREATSSEATEPGLLVEEDASPSYNPVVKYIGNIDVTNKPAKQGQTYTEIYLHIPKEHGSTPTVLWRPLEDHNYRPGMAVNGDGEFIFGRDSTSSHPAGLDLTAYYDDDISDRYIIDSPLGATATSMITTSTGKNHIISKTDGVVLDFDPQNYGLVASREGLSSIYEMNSLPQAQNFDFNCVLVYYDVFDPANPDDRATNLYGILVLDNYTNDPDGGAIERIKKLKPNELTNANGNSYAFTLNIKYDNDLDNAAPEVSINDYNSFSMDLFMDAMTRLQTSFDMFEEQKSELVELKNEVEEIKNIASTIETSDELFERMRALEQKVENARIGLEDSNGIFDLIEDVNRRVDSILNGQAPVDLSFDLEMFNSGTGIEIQRTSEGLRFETNASGYTIPSVGTQGGSFSYVVDNGTQFETDPNDDDFFPDNNVLFLEPLDNYFRESGSNGPSDDELRVNISDERYTWSTGQTLRIAWGGSVDMDGNPMIFRTDVRDEFGFGVYGVEIGRVEASELTSSKPIIEIVCLDAASYEFAVDVVKP